MEPRIDDGEQLAMIAHDLNSWLTCIQGYMGMMEDPALDTIQRKEFASQATFCAHEMAMLVRDLRDLAQMQQGRFALCKSWVDLGLIAEKVSGVLRLSARAPGVAISCKKIPESTWVMADPDRIAQVLHNLLVNALKHVGPEGKIEVTLHASERYLSVSVADDGTGLSPSLKPLLFQKFSRGENESQAGHGLGLYIAKIIVEAHGGKIGAHSEGIGKGSTFHFILPKGKAGATWAYAQQAQPVGG